MANKNLNIYLLNENLNSFKEYLKYEFHDLVDEYYVKKSAMGADIQKGIIFILEKTHPSPPFWTEYVNEISLREKIIIPKKKVSKCVIFLKVRSHPQSKTFALTFGNGEFLLESDYMVPDFGLKISKSLLTVDEIVSIDSVSIDRKIFNTRKQSSSLLMPEKLRDSRSHSIVRKIYGSSKKLDEEFSRGFSVGGSAALKFSGELDLLGELSMMLSKFGKIYQDYTDSSKKFALSDDLILVTSRKEREILDEILGKKIFEIINSSSIDKRKTLSLKISPQEIFNLDDFNGFFINGLGYKNSINSTDFYIDELDYLMRFEKKIKEENRNVPGILNKLKADEISKKTVNTTELERICSVYKAINFETQYKGNYYILISGKWYEFDKDFYNKLKKDIDSIPTIDLINGKKFIKFDSNLHKTIDKNNKEKNSEGKYNEDLAKQNALVFLDQKNYSISAAKKRELDFKSQSNIEICDLLHHTDEIIQFIHVKRHSGASGTSHLLSQAITSAQTFNNDKKDVIKHVNEEIKKFNNDGPECPFEILEDLGQKREVILAIIDKNTGTSVKNSKMLSILEMLSLRENMLAITSMGYNYYLNFIPSNE